MAGPLGDPIGLTGSLSLEPMAEHAPDSTKLQDSAPPGDKITKQEDDHPEGGNILSTLDTVHKPEAVENDDLHRLVETTDTNQAQGDVIDQDVQEGLRNEPDLFMDNPEGYEPQEEDDGNKDPHWLGMNFNGEKNHGESEGKLDEDDEERPDANEGEENAGEEEESDGVQADSGYDDSSSDKSYTDSGESDLDDDEMSEGKDMDSDVFGKVVAAMRQGKALKAAAFEKEKKPLEATKLESSTKARSTTTREYWTKESQKAPKRNLKRSMPGPLNPKSTKKQKILNKTPNTDTTTELQPMGHIAGTTHKEMEVALKARIAAQGFGQDNRRTETQGKDLFTAIGSFGWSRCKFVDGGGWLLRHTMKTPLKMHQLPVVAWMCKREICSDTGGGLYCDAMGFGKTITTLACISEHFPEAGNVDGYCPATLVVVNNSDAADHWMEEVKKHCKSPVSKNTKIYKHDKEVGIDYYSGQRIVITTYGQVRKQWPSAERLALLKERYKGNQKALVKAVNRLKGPLFGAKWFRVVLDEAHEIKNRNSSISLACAQLNAKYRWGLTGTPLSNDPIELFPYLRFLNCNLAEDIFQFKKNYLNGEKSAKNFDHLVNLMMYRRTHEDTYMGFKIIDLPGVTREDIWGSLSTEEQIISEYIFEHLAQSGGSDSSEHQDDEAVKEEEEENAPPNMLQAVQEDPGIPCKQGEVKPVQIAGPTAMRAVSHPFNLEKLLRTQLGEESITSMKKKLAEQGGKLTVSQQLLLEVSASKIDTKYAVGIQMLEAFRTSAFGGFFNMDGLLELVRNRKLLEGALCAKCGSSPNAPRKSYQCDHIYCLNCLMQLWCTASRNQTEHRCVSEGCSAMIMEELPEGKVHDWTLETPDIESAVGKTYKDEAYREPGQDEIGTQIGKGFLKNGFFRLSTSELGINVVPGAKLSMAMSVILQWQAEHPGDKIVVFTQFIMTGKILGWMLHQSRIQYLLYYGECNKASRAKALRSFKNNPNIKVMIMGLKAGGQALNITEANRVILVDPWWNSTREEQAFARVKRYGQEKEMYLVRILCNTIDNIISRMQIRKGIKIAYALQDDKHKPAEVNQDHVIKLFIHPLENKVQRGRQKIYMPDSSGSKKESGLPMIKVRGGKASKKGLGGKAGKKVAAKLPKRTGKATAPKKHGKAHK